MNKNIVTFKKLQVQDITINYVNWFKDNEVTKYSNNQYYEIDLNSQKKYVKSCLKSDSCDLFGIFFENLHIGNILINEISILHKRAQISYVIGNKNYWSKGIGTKAIKFIVEKARSEYKLKKIYASCSDANIASKTILKKNGFIVEGKRKQHLFYQNKWHDQIDFGLIL